MKAINELCKAYGEILMLVEQGPHYQFVSVAQGWFMSKLKLPISSLFTRNLLVIHINNVLDHTKHSLRLRIFTASLTTEQLDEYQSTIKTLDEFSKLLPKIPYSLVLFVYAVIIALISQNTFTNINDATFANNLMLSLLKLDVKGFLASFEGVEDQSIYWRLPVFWIMMLGFLAYPVYTSFIYKRILFNTYPNIAAMDGAHLTDHFDSMLGVYELEKQFFNNVAIKGVHETPIDLIVFELLYVFGLCCGILPAYIAITTGIMFWYYVAVPNIVIALFMMFSLYMTKRSRYGNPMS
jgi:hypothetical protein